MEKLGVISFFVFVIASFIFASERKKMQSKNISDWITDLTSLAVHFFVIPGIQVIVVYGLLDYLVPQWKGILPSNFWIALGLNLLLDYAWYWNHRILHAQTPLWNLHKTHHAPESLDVFVTSRNALVTHFLMVYFWFIGGATYLLQDPTLFLGIAAIGSVINFWGHTSFALPCESTVNKILSAVIVTPREHHWHHSQENPNCNFATVFTFWDRMHKTMHCKSDLPAAYGEPSKKTVWNQLFWPF